MIKQITKEELISAVRGLNIKEFTTRELEYFNDLLKVKSRQIDTEVNKRKAEGNN